MFSSLRTGHSSVHSVVPLAQILVTMVCWEVRKVGNTFGEELMNENGIIPSG